MGCACQRVIKENDDDDDEVKFYGDRSTKTPPSLRVGVTFTSFLSHLWTSRLHHANSFHPSILTVDTDSDHEDTNSVSPCLI